MAGLGTGEISDSILIILTKGGEMLMMEIGTIFFGGNCRTRAYTEVEYNVCRLIKDEQGGKAGPFHFFYFLSVDPGVGPNPTRIAFHFVVVHMWYKSNEAWAEAG